MCGKVGGESELGREGGREGGRERGERFREGERERGILGREGGRKYCISVKINLHSSGNFWVLK